MTPWTAAHQAPLSSTLSWCLLKFMSVELVMLSNRLILCQALLLLPSVFLSIRLFSSESAVHIRWPKYWSFSFSISPFSEYSGFPLGLTGLISLLSKEKCLLQHHSLKASVLRHTGFFMAQLSFLCVCVHACVELELLDL